MNDFPKQLPTNQVTSLCGQQRLPYPDHGPTGPHKEETSDGLDTSPDKKPVQVQAQAHLQAPRENLFQRAKTWFGFGRHY